jgi:hypothetical protein
MPPKPTNGNWVQTERAAHEAWGALILKSPLAARIMHQLVAQVGDHNAVVVSQETLASLVSATRRGVQKALKVLQRGHWLELRQLGSTGSVNAYVLNSRVVWHGSRDGIRRALFSAVVIVSEDEQPDRADLDRLVPLRPIPALFPGEWQLPAGDGLDPPSQPSIDGLEPDLPARQLELKHGS